MQNLHPLCGLHGRERITFAILGQSCQTFSISRKRINVLGFPGHTVSAATTQLCCYSKETSIARA